MTFYMGLSYFINSFPFQRFVPFAAVASANLVNIPLMRQVSFQLNRQRKRKTQTQRKRKTQTKIQTQIYIPLMRQVSYPSSTGVVSYYHNIASSYRNIKILSSCPSKINFILLLLSVCKTVSPTDWAVGGNRIVGYCTSYFVIF